MRGDITPSKPEGGFNPFETGVFIERRSQPRGGDSVAAPGPTAGSKADPKDVELGRKHLNELLLLCSEQDASDLHLSQGNELYMRVEGALHTHDNGGPLTGDQMERIVEALLDGHSRQPLHAKGSVDGAVTGPDGSRFRYNIFREKGQLAVALRRLEDRFRTLQELGLPESLYRLCTLTDGLVIMAGPTGSGKSTTLATLLHRINETRNVHIITVEDPIEYVHKPARSLVNQRELGLDANSFYDALVAALRQDPDVILVGEMRDVATVRTAMAAAQTGHLVFTTLHAGDCVGSIERLVAAFPSHEQDGARRQLALVLRAVICQHLLLADGQAGQEVRRQRNGNAAATCRPDMPAKPRPPRVLASEVLMVTPAVSNLIANGNTSQVYSAIETGSKQGMQSLEQDLARLWSKSYISEATAMALSRSPHNLRDRARLHGTAHRFK